jgi:hypothetical protein
VGRLPPPPDEGLGTGKKEKKREKRKKRGKRREGKLRKKEG